MKAGGGCLVLIAIAAILVAFIIYNNHTDSIEAANCAKIGGVYYRAGIDSNSCIPEPSMGPNCKGIVIPFNSDGSIDYDYANSALSDTGWQDCFNR